MTWKEGNNARVTYVAVGGLFFLSILFCTTAQAVKETGGEFLQFTSGGHVLGFGVASHTL